MISVLPEFLMISTITNHFITIIPHLCCHIHHFYRFWYFCHFCNYTYFIFLISICSIILVTFTFHFQLLYLILSYFSTYFVISVKFFISVFYHFDCFLYKFLPFSLCHLGHYLQFFLVCIFFCTTLIFYFIFTHFCLSFLAVCLPALYILHWREFKVKLTRILVSLCWRSAISRTLQLKIQEVSAPSTNYKHFHLNWTWNG